MSSRRTRRLLATAAALAAVSIGMTACSGDAAEQADAGGKIKVATSTDVWGSVVTAVGGDKVDVTPVIDDPAKDPHTYESNAEDATKVVDAKLVLYNGGGYDDFFTKLTEQASDVRKVVAFDVSDKGGDHGEEGHDHGEEGHDHAEEGKGAEAESGCVCHGEGEQYHCHCPGGTNEHVWYDLPTVSKVADQVATQLGELQPESKQLFTDNANAFKGKIDGLKSKAEQIGVDHPGSKVVSAEPVAQYLLETSKVEDKTPADFVKAIEGGSDVPAAAQDSVNQLINDKQVNAMINNPQTSTPVTDQLAGSAKNAGLPVVPFTETLPEGVNDYAEWMGAQVDALAGALNGQ